MPAQRPALILERYLPLRTFHGGMGAVFLCADMHERRPIALKTFLPHLLAEVEAREQFVREASVWVQIGAHPHVVAATMVRRDRDQIYVLCEMVAPAEGKSTPSLRGWLGAPLPPGQAIEFALGIARGMKWATTRVPGLVHRDLKPENVLVGRDLRARVADFGLALVRGRGTGGLCGTPACMAPEQWSGAADERSDVYAFGLVLLEMLTGATGIPPGPMAEIAAAHRGGAPAGVAASAPIPPALRPLIAAAVAVDPARRPPSWAAVEHLLLQAWPHLVATQPPALPAPAEMTLEQRVLEGWSHNALANALVDLGHLQDAASGYPAVLDTARQLGDAALEAAALGNLGQVLAAMGQLGPALEMLEASLAIKRRLGDRLGEANSLGNRGNALVRQNRVAEGLADHAEAASIYAALGRPADEIRAQVNTIPALAQLGRTGEAMAIGRDLCDRLRALGDAHGEGVLLGTIGQILRRSGEPAQALDCSERALACFRSCANRLAEARELSFQGHTLRAMRRMPEALDRFEESLKLADEVGDTLLVGSASFALAEMTPVLPRFLELGRHHAGRAAAAYRAAGREDLATDADALARRFSG